MKFLRLISELRKREAEDWFKTKPNTFYFDAIRNLIGRWTK